MSLFQDILNVHLDWLNKNGYREGNINSLDKPGTFAATLKKRFEKVIISSLWDDTPTLSFSNSITGRFKDNQHFVHYSFTYNYDPKLVKLKLSNLTTEWNGHRQVFQIFKAHDLPTAEKAYEKV